MGIKYSMLAKTLMIMTVLCSWNPVYAKAIENETKIMDESQILNQTITVDGRKYIAIDAVSDYLLNVKDVIKQVGPSVVGIIGNLKENSSLSKGDNIVFGSGVIYKSNGYIVTNAHVVKDMQNIVVVLSNGNSYKAKLKAIDEKTDLAVIKIDKGGLAPVSFGEISNVEVGDRVVAIGTPMSFSLRNSATIGIVSGINRTVKSEYAFIQSDAAINGGNSGGPLVNMKGEVIGINTVKMTGVGVEGLSFSIPADTVKYVIGHFEKYGKVKRPFLGVEFMEGIAAKYGLPSHEGLSIAKIIENSPASKNQLEVDDVLVAVNDVKLASIIDFNEEMKKYLPGDTVEFHIERKGESMKVMITFEEEKSIPIKP